MDQTAKIKCTHSQRRVEWVDEEDWWGGRGHSDYKVIEEDTFVDLDLYRFKCTLCGEIQYYSKPL